MKKFIKFKLKILAKAILAKYKPEIIGITGSVGKTGAKEAVYAVLSSKFNARRSVKNYNNEIGVPLTVIGAETQGKSVWGWIKVFLAAVKLILRKDENYPKILILEMGVDRPGDMKYLLSVVRPRIGIITRIASAHLEFFGSMDAIKKEKELLVKKLPKSGTAILNYGDERIRKIDGVKAEKITYGSPDADISARDVRASDLSGIEFVLSAFGREKRIRLENMVGETAVEAALAAAAVGIAHNMSLDEIGEALRSHRRPPGRMNLLPGIKNSFVIDDTYNASPESCAAALEAVRKISLPAGARKVVVLGDMLELGGFSEEGHRTVGREVVESGAAKLIVVGERARDIARGAEEAGMKRDDIFHFSDADAARLFVQERMREGDLVLVKGSQGMRMEKIVKEIMAEPLRAEELLVRQGKEWAEP